MDSLIVAADGRLKPTIIHVRSFRDLFADTKRGDRAAMGPGNRGTLTSNVNFKCCREQSDEWQVMSEKCGAREAGGIVLPSLSPNMPSESESQQVLNRVAATLCRLQHSSMS